MKYYFSTLLVAFLVLLQSAHAQSARKGDVLSITIKGVPVTEQAEVGGQYMIDGRGNIRMPMLNTAISASGRSTTAIASAIEAAYRAAEIYTNPRITILNERIGQEDSQNKERFVTVGGQVRRSGQIPYRAGMTLFEAIQSAGGETEFGDMKKVRLTRGRKSNIYSMKVIANQQIKIFPRDVITVPQKKLGIF